jgi:hypothetical protein
MYGEGLHTTPHRRGSDVRCYPLIDAIPRHLTLRPLQWFSLIVQNRPAYSENIDELSDIDDIRNGMLAHHSAHWALDLRNAVILHVRHLCSLILSLSHRAASLPKIRLPMLF